MCGETKIMQTIEQCKEKYERYKAAGLKLDMSRGKPAADQLDLSRALLSQPGQEESCLLENGLDCRNYGLPAGLPAMRALFADILGVRPENVIAGGNSSLNIMFDTVAQAYSKGVCGEKPWCSEKVKFLCPVPGYDRHFGITEYFGVEMINIPVGADGPDMDAVERYVESDASIKGIWCVPKYSNPTGITYSDETVRRFARLRPKAADFRIYWDNSYVLHDIGDTPDTLLNLYAEAEACGNEDIVFLFTSTSKITFPGAGVAVMAASDLFVAEQADHTIRFSLMRPVGKGKLFFSKALAVFVLCAFDLAVMYLVTTLAQVGLGGGTEGVLTSLGACLLDLIPLAVLILFFSLVNQVGRGSGLTVLLCVVCYIGLLVLGTYLPAVGGLVFTGYLRWHNLWIGITLPFFSLLPRIGLLAGYGLVFGCGGYWLFDRKEA